MVSKLLTLTQYYIITSAGIGAQHYKYSTDTMMPIARGLIINSSTDVVNLLKQPFSPDTQELILEGATTWLTTHRSNRTIHFTFNS